MTQNQVKRNKSISNIKRTATIIYLLKLNGITQQAIANELGMQKSAVCRAINMHARSRKVENWLKENLGI